MVESNLQAALQTGSPLALNSVPMRSAFDNIIDSNFRQIYGQNHLNSPKNTYLSMPAQSSIIRGPNMHRIDSIYQSNAKLKMLASHAP